MRTRFTLALGLVIAACIAFAPPPAHASPNPIALVQRDTSCVATPVEAVTIHASSIAPVTSQAGIPASDTLLLSLAGIVGMTAAASTKREIDGAVTLGGRVYTKGQEDELARVLPKKDIERLHNKGVLKGDWITTRERTEPDPVKEAAARKESVATETTAGSGAAAKAKAAKTAKAETAKAAKTAKKRTSKRAAKKGE